jgi:DNA-directed RNA polymerase II subunit RPB9
MTSLRTCAECNNILYPREDPDNKRLLYACRHCDYSEIASQALVYRNDLQKSASETAGVTTDVASDPTLVPPISYSSLVSYETVLIVAAGE